MFQANRLLRQHTPNLEFLPIGLFAEIDEDLHSFASFLRQIFFRRENEERRDGVVKQLPSRFRHFAIEFGFRHHLSLNAVNFVKGAGVNDHFRCTETHYATGRTARKMWIYEQESNSKCVVALEMHVHSFNKLIQLTAFLEFYLNVTLLNVSVAFHVDEFRNIYIQSV